MIPNDFGEACRRIKILVSDVDGVLTDGGMYYSETGDELKKFNVRDGTGVILLKQAGIRVGVMTGEDTKLVEWRASKLNLDFCVAGARNKLAKLNDLLSNFELDMDEVAYVGDGINDIELLGKVGIFFTVKDASPFILQRADFVLQTLGGMGALEELASLLLSERDELEEALAAYQQSLQ